MLVTLSGIVMLVRELHLEKALLPMLVTLSGIVTLVRALQYEKALSPMLVTLSGIEKCASAFPGAYKISVVASLLYKFPSMLL